MITDRDFNDVWARVLRLENWYTMTKPFMIEASEKECECPDGGPKLNCKSCVSKQLLGMMSD